MKQLTIIIVLTMTGAALLSQARPTIVDTSPVIGETVQAKQLKKPSLKPPKALSQSFKQKVVKVTAVRPTGDCRDWMRQAGVTDMANAYELIMRESGCRVDADNPTSDAYGIPQSLPGSKMASEGTDWATNPVTQIRWMEKYVMERYGSWGAAVSFHDANNYY